MKTYIVYVDGNEMGMIKAASHNAAEKKAKAKYCPTLKEHHWLSAGPSIENRVSVVYTEV